MWEQEPHSREELVAYTIEERFRRKYHIVHISIPAWWLLPKMVIRIDGRPRVIVSVRRRNSKTGGRVTIELAGGPKTFAGDAPASVWYIEGKPFLMELPPEDPAPADGSALPAQDAAGIVPVWRGPVRPN